MSKRTLSTDAEHSTTRRRLLTVASAGVVAGLAGCSSGPGESTPIPSEEATVTITLENRDSVPRSYEIVVDQGSSVSDQFSGTVPAGESVEMVASFKLTDEQYDFSINTDGGQRGQTWDPTECADLAVDAAIQDGNPQFETRCRSE
ncbi:hypothetical protein [Halogeometricum limi]|uniref:Uncharacterized protein n=1 Tax=Halogeometricum limi TaxID=555875 RepID=A0A1I6FR96_9EURY|nr:hypothetical protein [Halogeometricum limi]SFR32418.1 hypothetical protein SAMN04488124_0119 [Halogeometricum limi]